MTNDNLVIETTAAFRAEKEYCFHVLLRELLGLDYQLRFTAETEHYRLHLPGGAVLTVEDGFWGRFREEKYLDAGNVPDRAETVPSPFDGTPLSIVFGRNHFETDSRTGICGLDVFASTFFMLSRWEEHVLPDRDRHGRFPAERSLAFRAGFLDRPVVNEYAELLRQMFARLGFETKPPTRSFSLHLSCDVDHPRLWWQASGPVRTLAASLLRRGNLREAAYWLPYIVPGRKDPYDVFDDWMDVAEKAGLRWHFNFLGKRPPESDCWYPLEAPQVQALIRNMENRGHHIGFHPSYEAFEDAEKFKSELDSLRQTARTPVLNGRQHYLRFAAPQTWRMWENTGMAWDSTLGYPEAEGFRCGICCDFPVFDFLNRRMLHLREKPLLAMDVTLALYRQYTPETALERLLALRRQVERHRGEFVLLWHNSSWNTYFWAPWRAVFNAFVLP